MNGKRRALPRQVVIATRNAGKLREIEAILRPFGWEILSLKDLPHIPGVAEDGATFAENAAKKAAEVARQTGRIAVADDSGLVVEALQGRPGVFSSRYAGENATDEERCEKLLAELSGVPEAKRGAVFVCAIAAATPRGKTEIVEGECRGRIALAPRGKQGFGYDPIFFVPELGRTMAELPPEVKNRISHRARALTKLKEIFPRLLGPPGNSLFNDKGEDP